MSWSRIQSEIMEHNDATSQRQLTNQQDVQKPTAKQTWMITRNKWSLSRNQCLILVPFSCRLHIQCRFCWHEVCRPSLFRICVFLKLQLPESEIKENPSVIKTKFNTCYNLYEKTDTASVLVLISFQLRRLSPPSAHGSIQTYFARDMNGYPTG